MARVRTVSPCPFRLHDSRCCPRWARRHLCRYPGDVPGFDRPAGLQRLPKGWRQFESSSSNLRSPPASVWPPRVIRDPLGRHRLILHLPNPPLGCHRPDRSDFRPMDCPSPCFPELHPRRRPARLPESVAHLRRRPAARRPPAAGHRHLVRLGNLAHPDRLARLGRHPAAPPDHPVAGPALPGNRRHLPAGAALRLHHLGRSSGSADSPWTHRDCSRPLAVRIRPAFRTPISSRAVAQPHREGPDPATDRGPAQGGSRGTKPGKRSFDPNRDACSPHQRRNRLPFLPRQRRNSNGGLWRILMSWNSGSWARRAGKSKVGERVGVSSKTAAVLEDFEKSMVGANSQALAFSSPCNARVG